MNPDLAPLVLFCYDRPDHVLQVLESIERNELADETRLIIYSDGLPVNANPGLSERVAAVRKVIRSRKWCGLVEIHESGNNKGLAESIISGVSEVLGKYGKIIVLEDDLVTSPYFLRYMNAGLDFYSDTEEVIGITAYIYPVKDALPETFFLKGADCWGWATWSRGWNLFNRNGAALLRELEERNLSDEFDFGNSYPYTRMLKDQVEGKNQSWAIRWYASAFLAGKLSLYPGKSLVANIGIDSSGTHSGTSSKWEVELSSRPLNVKLNEVREDREAKKIISKYFRTISQPPTLLKRILNKLKGGSKGWD